MSENARIFVAIAIAIVICGFYAFGAIQSRALPTDAVRAALANGDEGK